MDKKLKNQIERLKKFYLKRRKLWLKTESHLNSLCDNIKKNNMRFITFCGIDEPDASVVVKTINYNYHFYCRRDGFSCLREKHDFVWMIDSNKKELPYYISLGQWKNFKFKNALELINKIRSDYVDSHKISRPIP